MKSNQLKNLAVSQTLFKPTTLKKALNKLDFIQADPIRSPARAQDLMLRHRGVDYKIDDLENLYPKLNLEEDYLYAYGFVTKELRDIFYPRSIS